MDNDFLKTVKPVVKKYWLGRVKPFIESPKTKKRLFILGSFSAGCLSFVLFMDMIVMPIYLREGLEIHVPDCTNKTYAEAYSIVHNHRLSLIADGSEYSEDVPKDRVASQRPLPNTLVKPGRGIHVVVSLGPPSLTVPDVVGKSPRDAELEIKGAGLTVVEKRYRESRRYPRGVVIDQRPKAHTEVQTKTGVILIISKTIDRGGNK
jgi:eukaryotic-like serine/threonine-protein kinase